jgi:hypothetical protein
MERVLLATVDGLPVGAVACDLEKICKPLSTIWFNFRNWF